MVKKVSETMATFKKFIFIPSSFVKRQNISIFIYQRIKVFQFTNLFNKSNITKSEDNVYLYLPSMKRT